MSIKKRRGKHEAYDVYATFQKKPYKIASVSNRSHATAISDFVREVIAYSKFSFVRAIDARTIKTLSEEAYQELKKISAIFDIEHAEFKEEENRKREQELNSRHFEILVSKRIENEVEKVLRTGSAPIPILRNSPYPPPPIIRISATKCGDDLPECSGVYFVWLGNNCEYVGQSVNIARRANLSHEKITALDKIGFLLFDRSELLFAESFYIGIMRPQRNFRGLRLQGEESILSVTEQE